jgi:hypothetical protein
MPTNSTAAPRPQLGSPPSRSVTTTNRVVRGSTGAPKVHGQHARQVSLAHGPFRFQLLVSHLFQLKERYGISAFVLNSNAWANRATLEQPQGSLRDAAITGRSIVRHCRARGPSRRRGPSRSEGTTRLVQVGSKGHRGGATPYGFAQVAVSRAWWRSGARQSGVANEVALPRPQALAGDSSSQSLTTTGLALVGATSGPPKVTGGTLGGRCARPSVA